jgi:hypothetical protein
MIYKLGKNIEIRVVTKISIWQLEKNRVNVIFLEYEEIDKMIKCLEEAKRYLESKSGTFKNKNQILQNNKQDNKQGI